MATDYGRDISGAIDISPTLQESTGLQLMREVAVRRQYTPDASLLSAPDEKTVDLRSFISADFPHNERGAQIVASAAVAALQADPRILSATVDATWETESYMVLRERIFTAEGPFDLVLGVNSVTISVLRQ